MKQIYLYYFVIVAAIAGVANLINSDYTDRVHGFSGYVPELGHGGASGHVLTHDVSLFWMGRQVRTHLKTYFFKDGSFIKEMILGALIYNAPENKFFSYNSESITLLEISNVNHSKTKYDVVKEKQKCSVENREFDCFSWTQVSTGRLGDVSAEMQSAYYSAALGGVRLKDLYRGVEYLFGKKTNEMMGFPIFGVIRSQRQVLFEIQRSSIRPFVGKQTVSEFLRSWFVKGRCEFDPVIYHCRMLSEAES